MIIPEIVANVVPKGIDFDGTNDYMEIPYDESVSPSDFLLLYAGCF